MMLLKVEDLDPDQQKERLELVVEGTRLGMWDWNPVTGDVIFDERWAGMLGYDLAEIEQSITSWERLVHPDDLADAYADIQAHMNGETEYYENIHRMKHRDGHWIYILDRGRIAEWDEQGNAIRFTGTHTDITREKEAELKALAAVKAKSLFLANMSHEIRTPLNGMLGLLQLLQETSLNTQQEEWIDVIMACGEGLLAVINDILDLSKIEAGKITIEPVQADIRKAFKLVYDLFQEKAQSKRLEYKLNIDEQLPELLLIDIQRIKQVLLNLVSNAIKFTDRGSVTISVEGRPLGADQIELIVSVQDTGKGIANTDVIWDQFTQEDNSIEREFGGTGLGLSISKSLLSMMDGSLDLMSEVGVGSTFQLCIPCQRVDLSFHSRRYSIDKKSLVPCKILVAEDNSVNQLVIHQVLLNLGMRPTIVSDGEAAVEACKREEYELIFMDLHMPKLNGIEATRKIHSESSIKGNPIIVALSADAMSGSKEACIEAGMVDFVYKPFKIDEIIEVIANVTETRAIMAEEM
ncbi:MAG: response regulator [Rhodothermaceae bacterium]|nr:response regulator [Rhodothermaceae bacterium]